MSVLLSSQKVQLFLVLMLQLFLQPFTAGCATAHGKNLPVLVEGEPDAALITAHQEANKAYVHCREETENQIPWAAVATSGAFLSGAALVAGGGTAALVFNQDPLLFPLGIGVAASSTGLFVLSAWSAFSVPENIHRQRIRDAALKQSRHETMLALDDRDSAALLRVKRNLYENCRVAVLAADGESGDVLLRDYARYRREAEELRRWHKDLQDELAAQKLKTESPVKD